MPGGARTHTYFDRPIRILSVEGQRWGTWAALERASAYHALVIFPPGELSNAESVSGGDDFTHTKVERWRLMRGQPPGRFTAEERELEIVYDALWQTVTVGTRTYQLANGNLFVVRYDEQLQPAVTQLNATLNREGSTEEVVAAFKAQLREDAIAQQLH